MEDSKKRIGYISDLHLEHYSDPWVILNKIAFQTRFFDVDYLVIAGDLSNMDDAIKYLCYLGGRTKEAEVIYVPGNHEFYGSHIDKVHDFCKTNLPDNVHMLNRKTFEDTENGIQFIGAVGWIDGSWANPYNKQFYKRQYNDFNCIKGYDRLGLEYGKADKRSIERALEDSLLKSVVITHFLPRIECIQTKYLGNLLNHCFSNNWEGKWFRKYNIDAWIFGHSHNRDSFTLDGTKLCTNCLGYPHEGNNVQIDIIEV